MTSLVFISLVLLALITWNEKSLVEFQYTKGCNGFWFFCFGLVFIYLFILFYLFIYFVKVQDFL